MAKGAKSKDLVYQKVVSMFGDAFLYNDDKEVRINVNEDGEIVQLKMTLTVTKSPVESPNAAGAEDKSTSIELKEVAEKPFEEKEPSTSQPALELSQEEKDDLAMLLQSLNMNQ